MAYPEKKKRNDRIEKLYKAGAGVRAIGRMERIAHPMVIKILKRRGVHKSVSHQKESA